MMGLTGAHSTYHGLLAGIAWRDMRRGRREGKGRQDGLGGGEDEGFGGGEEERRNGVLGGWEEERWGAELRKPGCTVYA